jgi:hypothetical protein
VSRRIGEVYPHAYYVVKRSEDGAELAVWGPYATKSAAKGQRSSRESNHRYYGGAASTSFGVVESPAGQWTEVTL